jgi:hypothetical protein
MLTIGWLLANAQPTDLYIVSNGEGLKCSM